MIKKWAASAANRITEFIAALLMRSAIKPLLHIDDRSLADVGLSRSDVVESLATPLTTDPGRFLALRAKRRGRASRRA
ncbi:hypothetical protein [Bradyrhizobium sp.]|uniref:hypothetical protein n=1 Tax=Bradyrhizobium sp. TaxID=376 RepID=UPI0025B84064|nr:hypothetical protein [Bradyrhizobium sp.]